VWDQLVGQAEAVRGGLHHEMDVRAQMVLEVLQAARQADAILEAIFSAQLDHESVAFMGIKADPSDHLHLPS
jgi:hypothetical protein